MKLKLKADQHDIDMVLAYSMAESKGECSHFIAAIHADFLTEMAGDKAEMVFAALELGDAVEFKVEFKVHS